MAVQHGKGTEYVKTNAHAAMMAATLVFGGALLNVDCSATSRGITVASTQADGAFESWRYTWNSSPGGGESWGLNGYEYKKGNRDIQ